ncbi:hypothetical protein C4577_01985 [Candidatus Parcubacteria bacterium]|nr:MAG: hypothetical protein C4577_01985 [Candidatus Parcubacteria bacterium]
MGTTRWSDAHYTDRISVRAATNTPTFAYDSAVKTAALSGKVEDVHKSLNIKDVKMRESRDSKDHPTSTAVAVLFDVTGSMSTVPAILQKNLPKLMGLLIRKGYVEHPQIMIGAIGDATCDRYPIQIGQFESGIEMEDNLTNIILEGGGGGQKTESYELAMYFMAKHTSLDCFEKRNKKGYLFIVGDEMAYNKIDRKLVKQYIGDDLEANLSTKNLVEELKKMYEVYYILPKQTAHYNDTDVESFWKGLLGQNFLKLDDPAGISELIATTVGLVEGNTDIESVKEDLKEVGTNTITADAVSRALVELPNTGKKLPAKVKSSSKKSGVAKV